MNWIREGVGEACLSKGRNKPLQFHLPSKIYPSIKSRSQAIVCRILAELYFSSEKQMHSVFWELCACVCVYMCVHMCLWVCVGACVYECVCACVSVCRGSVSVYSDLLYHGIPRCFEADSFMEHGTHVVLCRLMASCQAHDASFCLLPNLRVVEWQEL